MIYFLYIFLYLTLCKGYAFNSTHQSEARHPNVLFIIVDDLRPALGSYGDPLAVTPNIDQLAAQGTIFTKAYAQQALCGPSRTSFLTSRRPDTTRLIDVHYYWRAHAGNFTTLPQYFKEHGYHTTAAGKIFHPGIVSNHSDDQPYSWSETPYHPSSQAHKQDPVCLSGDGRLHTNIYCPVEVDKQPEKTLPDIQTAKYAVKWLNKRHKRLIKDPFFLAVGFHKPHIPLKFPKQYLKFFPIDKIKPVPNNRKPRGLPDVAWNPWNDMRRRDDIAALNISFPYGPIPDNYSRYIRQGYYAATTYVDDLIGAVISSTLSHFSDTIIALIGDHGWSLGEHQEWSKFSNFEVSTRVPFIISLPQQRNKIKKSSENIGFQKSSSRQSKGFKDYSNNNYNNVVELLDIFPTLVDLTGLPAIQICPKNSSKINVCTEGVSLSPIVLNNDAKTNFNKKNLNDCDFNYSENDVFYEICQHRAFDTTERPSFSQYPRPGVKPTIVPDSDQPRLTDTKFMGYSMRTPRFRYTAWLKFNHTTFISSWDDLVDEELYDHKIDPGENQNVVRKRVYSHYLPGLRHRLKTKLD